MIRKTVWAGPRNFYPDNPEILKKSIAGFIDSEQIKEECKAVLLPHAGYFYSGEIAGRTISCVKVPDTVIILGPNHTGIGSLYSLISKGSWQTPLGYLNIQEDLAQILLENTKFIKEDELPHIKEHSIKT